MTETIKEQVKSAFVILPITVPKGEYNGDPDHFRHVYEYIFKPALVKAGYAPDFPESKGSELIHGNIIDSLQKADIVLCDMTLLNPNVFYELGIRTALNKPICLVKDDKTLKIPFDISIINIREYSSKLNVWELDEQVESISNHIIETVKKKPNTNALWEVFGMTISSSGIEAPKNQDEKIKALELEIELLRQNNLQILKENQDRINTVETVIGKYHKCSNCAFGFLIEDQFKYYGSALLKYLQPDKTIKTVKCPKCGNVDEFPSDMNLLL